MAIVIGGTDPTLGAGVVADALVLVRHGVQPLVVETAIVEQDSRGVDAAWPLDPDLVARQIARACADIPPRVAKIGMLGTPELARAVFAALDRAAPSVPWIVDPVLAPSGGLATALATTGLAEAIGEGIRRAALVTPNARELAALVAAPVPTTIADAVGLARRLVEQTGASVLVKGGHLEPRGLDVLVERAGVTRFAPLRWSVDAFHGSGCALASAIAARVAHGDSLASAVGAARRFIARATRGAARLGAGQTQLVHVRSGR